MSLDVSELASIERAVGAPVSRETYEKLKSFEAELRRWSARINLIAPSTLPELWTRHILDSAQLLRLRPEALAWLDLGSGAGFPGAVLAILLRSAQHGSVDLVESNQKKAAFLRATLGALQVPGQVHVARAEEVIDRVRFPEIVTARALAPLSSLLSLTWPWLSNGATGLFHKGREFQSELEDCRDDWRFNLIQHANLIQADSVILEISNLGRVP